MATSGSALTVEAHAAPALPATPNSQRSETPSRRVASGKTTRPSIHGLWPFDSETGISQEASTSGGTATSMIRAVGTPSRYCG